MYLQAATAGAAFSAHTQAAAHVGMYAFWAYGSQNDWNKIAQISSKTAQLQTSTQKGGSLSLLTTPMSGGTGATSIPRLTIGPSGWSIFDDSMPSADGSNWSPAYITGVASLLELRGATTPTLTIKSYTAVTANQRGDIAVTFGAANGAINNTNGGLWIKTIVERTSPDLRSQVDFLSNIGNAMAEVFRFDAAGTTVAIRGLSVATGGATITGALAVTGSATFSTIVTAQSGLAVTGAVTFPAASITSPAISMVAVDPPSANQLTRDSIVKGWARVTVSGGTPTIASSFNVSTVVDNGVGDYTVVWSTPFANTSYAPVASSYDTGNIRLAHVVLITATSARIQVYSSAFTTVDPAGGFSVLACGVQ